MYIQGQKSLELSVRYLQKAETAEVSRPHKVWEAGSHSLTCALWSIFRDVGEL